MTSHSPHCAPLDFDIPDPTTQCEECIGYSVGVVIYALADLIAWQSLDLGDASSMITAVHEVAERAIELGLSTAEDLGVQAVA